jgi:hypothetical protein
MALSDAERKAAQRERERQALSAQSAEDDYVQRELAITRATFGDEPERLERSERYARWRFREHRLGTVAYL